MFYDNFINLCAKNGISRAKVAKAIGISGAAVSKWKDGGMPNDLTAIKLAEFFGVSIDELMQDTEQPQVDGVADSLSGVSSEDMEYIRKYLALGAKSKIAAQAVIDSLLGTESASRQAIAEDFVATAKEKSEAASNMQHSDFTKR